MRDGKRYPPQNLLAVTAWQRDRGCLDHPHCHVQLRLSCIPFPTPCSSHGQPLPPALPASAWLLPLKRNPSSSQRACVLRERGLLLQRACPDGLIQFDFLPRIYSSFLESLFHWRLPEQSRWRVHARVRVGLRDGEELNRQPLPLPPALRCTVPALCIRAARAGGISAFVE